MRALVCACARACVRASTRARARVRAWVGGRVRGCVGAWVGAWVGGWVGVCCAFCVSCVCVLLRRRPCSDIVRVICHGLLCVSPTRLGSLALVLLGVLLRAVSDLEVYGRRRIHMHRVGT